MKWIYKNNSKHVIIYNNSICKPDEIMSSEFPLPTSLGLTCIQEGSEPDPVILHDDVIINPAEEKSISLNSPALSKNIALYISCMTDDSGVECRFNNPSNNPIPIDARGFSQTLPWTTCSRIFLRNITGNQAVISISAVEVVS